MLPTDVREIAERYSFSPADLFLIAKRRGESNRLVFRADLVPAMAEPAQDVARADRKPNCRGAAAMKTENRIEFKTSDRAEAAGYSRARDCR